MCVIISYAVLISTVYTFKRAISSSMALYDSQFDIAYCIIAYQFVCVLILLPLYREF